MNDWAKKAIDRALTELHTALVYENITPNPIAQYGGGDYVTYRDDTGSIACWASEDNSVYVEPHMPARIRDLIKAHAATFHALRGIER